MRLYLVKEGERLVWVAALAHEVMYAYVANTGKFHDNNALRNDFYIDRHFTYEPIAAAEARRWIAEDLGMLVEHAEDLGMLNDTDHLNALAKWRAGPNPLMPTDVFSMAAGSNE